MAHLNAVHFVAFKGEEYWSARRIWGKPHFIHMGWDKRAQREILPGDIVIFSKGTDQDPFPTNPKTGAFMNFSDIIEAEPKG